MSPANNGLRTDPQPQANHQPFSDVHPVVTPPMHRRQASKHRFVVELSQCLFDFVIQLLPTQEEMAVKEDVRKLLEHLIRTIEPESRLLSFGSTANGFSLRNSGGMRGSTDPSSNLKSFFVDMDLCCLIDSEERLSATDLVTMLGDLLERGQTRPISNSRPLLLIIAFQKRNFTSSHYPMPVYRS